MSSKPNQAKRTDKPSSTIRATLLRYRLSILVILALAVVATLAELEAKYEAASLPAQYFGVCNPEGSSILFNGVDPGEGVATLQRNKPTLIQRDNFYGTNIYLVLGDRHQPVVLLAHPKDIATTELSTTITIPASYKQGATSLHIYSMLKSGECSDRWTEIYVE